MKIVVSEALKNLFPTKPDIRQAIKENMEKKGFSKAHPIILGRGPWSDGLTIIDGHTRYEVAQELDIELQLDSEFQPIHFETEEEAIRHAIFLQKCRRNMSDSEIASCIQVLDARKIPGRPAKKLASCDANLESSVSTTAQAESVSLPKTDESQKAPDSNEDSGSILSPVNQNTGKSAKETAELLGISTSKVERARVVLAVDTPDEIKNDVLSGKKSINRAAKEVKELKKAKTKPSKGSSNVCLGVANGAPSVKCSNIPESGSDKTPQFKNPSNVFNIRLEKIIARIVALPIPNHDLILEKFEELLTEFEGAPLLSAPGLEGLVLSSNC